MSKRSYQQFFLLLTVSFAVCVLGCGEGEAPPFRLNMTKVVATQIAPQHQRAIANILGAMFGTPDDPFAMPETGLNQRLLEMAAGPVVPVKGVCPASISYSTQERL